MPAKSELEIALAAFKKERAMLDGWIAYIESKLGIESGIGESAPSNGTDASTLPPAAIERPSQPQELRSDTFFMMSIPAAAKKYLGIIKRPAETQEIAEALKNGGIETKAKNFTLNVFSALNRDTAFIRVVKKWGLAEWYPSRPKQSEIPEKRKKRKYRRKNKATLKAKKQIVQTQSSE